MIYLIIFQVSIILGSNNMDYGMARAPHTMGVSVECGVNGNWVGHD